MPSRFEIIYYIQISRKAYPPTQGIINDKCYNLKILLVKRLVMLTMSKNGYKNIC